MEVAFRMGSGRTKVASVSNPERGQRACLGVLKAASKRFQRWCEVTGEVEVVDQVPDRRGLRSKV